MSALGLFNAVPILLYDLSIQDLQERKKKVKEFRSISRAADYLGIGSTTLMNNMGKRYTSKKDGKTYAIRQLTENTEKTSSLREIK
jgi:hypothetical protein